MIDFVEAGRVLRQPFKTYSLGMRFGFSLRLRPRSTPQHRTIDEALGAGDAYFSGKSAARMKRLTSGGCTLRCFSSMQQVL